MKKFLSVILLTLLIICNVGVAQAMRNETKDITKKNLDITDSFYKPMLSGNLNWTKTEYDNCLKAHTELYSYLDKYKPQRNESGYVIDFLSENDREVVYHAATIIALRIHALYDYILALEAHKSGDFNGQNTMIDACNRDLEYANDCRQSFTNLYGY